MDNWEFFQEICFLGTLACPAIVKEDITHEEFQSLLSLEKPIWIFFSLCFEWLLNGFKLLNIIEILLKFRFNFVSLTFMVRLFYQNHLIFLSDLVLKKKNWIPSKRPKRMPLGKLKNMFSNFTNIFFPIWTLVVLIF